MTNLQGWESEQSSSALVSRKNDAIIHRSSGVPPGNSPSIRQPAGWPTFARSGGEQSGLALLQMGALVRQSTLEKE